MDFERSSEIDKLADALSKAQGVLEGAAKDKKNPVFSSKYADLASCWEACRKPLSDNGLAVIQLPSFDGKAVFVRTVLTHSSGQWVSGIVSATAKKQLNRQEGGGLVDDDAPQSVAAAVTYLRRAGLCAAVGVAPEDDDGNSVSGKTKQQEEEPQAPNPAKVIESFRAFGVTSEMLEKRLGHPLSKLTVADGEDLGALWRQLDAGEPVEKHFPPAVNHTPVQGTDEPRPGEKKKTAAKKKEETAAPDAASAATTPVPTSGPVEVAQPPQTAEESRMLTAAEKNSIIKPVLSPIQAKYGWDAVKNFIVKKSGVKDPKELNNGQWAKVLELLVAEDQAGGKELVHNLNPGGAA